MVMTLTGWSKHDKQKLRLGQQEGFFAHGYFGQEIPANFIFWHVKCCQKQVVLFVPITSSTCAFQFEVCAASAFFPYLIYLGHSLSKLCLDANKEGAAEE